MLKAFVTLAILGMGVAAACSGTTVRLKGEEMEPGVFRVLQTSGIFEIPGSPDRYDSIGVSRMSDFKAYYQNLLADNDLVFMARIDSVISAGPSAVSWDTVIPGFVPDIVLAPEYSMPTSVAFFAHLAIDTVLKGSLPAKRFWVKGYSSVSTCGISPYVTKTATSFLNYSHRFDSTQHFKMTTSVLFCANCPASHWFDGRYLLSPNFPVLKLDIREVIPGYPVSIHDGARPDVRPPLRIPGKAYYPDGRTVNPVAEPKSPVPLLR